MSVSASARAMRESGWFGYMENMCVIKKQIRVRRRLPQMAVSRRLFAAPEYFAFVVSIPTGDGRYFHGADMAVGIEEVCIVTMRGTGALRVFASDGFVVSAVGIFASVGDQQGATGCGDLSVTFAGFGVREWWAYAEVAIHTEGGGTERIGGRGGQAFSLFGAAGNPSVFVEITVFGHPPAPALAIDVVKGDWHKVLIVMHMKDDYAVELAEVADALGFSGGLADSGNSGDENGGQDADNGNDGEKFDECEGVAAGAVRGAVAGVGAGVGFHRMRDARFSRCVW